MELLNIFGTIPVLSSMFLSLFSFVSLLSVIVTFRYKEAGALFLHAFLGSRFRILYLYN